MAKKTLEEFFAGKSLVIPEYQRDYAWNERNVDDLFEDVQEALDAGSSHYLGTFILSHAHTDAPFMVVDGQQRLTTLTMLLSALISVLENTALQQHYRSMFLEHPIAGAKLRARGPNQQFLAAVLNGEAPAPETHGQARLSSARQWIASRVGALRDREGQPALVNWLERIARLEVLEFIEPNEGRAIRMFQSVNDRGVPLSKMDIVKGLLIYYSNRYLDGALDIFVATKFGEAFRAFNRIKELAAETGHQIRNVDRDTFRDDDVLRYHYFAYDGTPFGIHAGADFNATAETVVEHFLKPSLKELRSNSDQLQSFISSYATDLALFFEGLQHLIERSRSHLPTYRLLVLQDLSATLYPLAVRLHTKEWLDRQTPDGRTLLHWLETVDLRVFKIRGTNPQADVAKITGDCSRGASIEQTVKALNDFCARFMSDALLAARLLEDDLYKNPGVPRMLLALEEDARKVQIDMGELLELTKGKLSVEHIFPQQPSFDTASYGFTDRQEYDAMKHRLGNLMLLEGWLNTRCSNKTIEEKITADNLYRASALRSVTEYAAKLQSRPHKEKKLELDLRAQRIADLVARTWPLGALQ